MPFSAPASTRNQLAPAPPDPRYREPGARPADHVPLHCVDCAGGWRTHWLAQGYFSPLPRVIRTSLDGHLLGPIMRLVELAKNPPAEVGRMMGGFLSHVPVRLESATRLPAGAA